MAYTMTHILIAEELNMNLKEAWTILHVYWEQLPPMQSMHNPISGSSRKSAVIYLPKD